MTKECLCELSVSSCASAHPDGSLASHDARQDTRCAWLACYNNARLMRECVSVTFGCAWLHTNADPDGSLTSYARREVEWLDNKKDMVFTKLWTKNCTCIWKKNNHILEEKKAYFVIFKELCIILGLKNPTRVTFIVFWYEYSYFSDNHYEIL